MISWQTAAHWAYVEAPFPFYLVFYDRGHGDAAAHMTGAESAGIFFFYSVTTETCLLAV